MTIKYENISIILARGGSKTIKNKNIKPLLSSNCVEITIRNLLTFLSPQQILLSSDSSKILSIGKKNGINVLLRPKEFSSDTASSESAWLHAIKYLFSKKIYFKTVIAPQVTCPLRYRDSIKNALIKYNKESFDSLFSAVKYSSHSFKWQVNEESLKPLNYDPLKKRKLRQEHPEASFIRENGSFFIFDAKGFIQNKNRLFGKIGYYLQDKIESIDIDEPEDWFIVESILKSNEKIFIY